MKHITANKKYVVSTANSFGTGWETLVFNFDRNTNSVTDWLEIDGQRYLSAEDAATGHERYIQKWEKEN